jgi:hypothetical protein
MEFLISFLAGIFAFAGGIIGNILANDLCVSANKLCTRIISRAAKRVGDDAQQKRYEEEWLADLAERETVYSKYQHAIGCYLISSEIRRESRKLVLHVLYFVPRYGKVWLKFNFSSRILLPIWFWTMDSKFVFVKNSALWLVMAYYVFRFARVAHVDQPGRLPQLVNLAGEALKNKSLKDWPFNVKLSRNGTSWNLTSLARGVLKDPNLITALNYKLGNKKKPKEMAEALIKLKDGFKE